MKKNISSILILCMILSLANILPPQGHLAAEGTEGSTETWQLQSPLWMLLGRETLTFWKEEAQSIIAGAGIQPSIFGGSLDYIIDGLNEDEEYYEQVFENNSTLLILNPIHEEPYSLEALPPEFSYLCPLSLDILDEEGRTVPFVYLERDETGMVRGILLVTAEEQLLEGLEILTGEGVTLNSIVRFGTQVEIDYPSDPLPPPPPPPTPDVLGDVDGSGTIDVIDAILVLKHIVGLINVGDIHGPEALVRGKVSSGSGSIHVGDAILILRYVVGLINTFPADDGEPGHLPDTGPGPWLELREGNLSVLYKAGYEADAENVLGWLAEAEVITQQYYPHDPFDIVEIYLHHPDEWTYSSGYATADPWFGPQAQMHFLAPSAHNSWRNTYWWRSNIIHEYVHIPTITQNQEMGYQDSPFWMKEGIAMYIPLVALPPSDNPQHIDVREQEREQIRNLLSIGRGYLDDLGISYPGATYVAQFMVETWGWEVYGSLFRSAAATFEAAVLEILEMDLSQLEQEWLAWACQEFDVDPAIYEGGRPPPPTFPEEPVEGDWSLEEPLWVLWSRGFNSDDIRQKLQDAGMWSTSYYGGSIENIAPGLSGYKGKLEWSNTLMIYNPTVEDISVFNIWPEEFFYLIPLELDSLKNEIDSLPFIYIRKCTYERFRAIIVAATTEQALGAVEYLLYNDTPLNQVHR